MSWSILGREENPHAACPSLVSYPPHTSGERHSNRERVREREGEGEREEGERAFLQPCVTQWDDGLKSLQAPGRHTIFISSAETGRTPEGAAGSIYHLRQGKEQG